MRRDRAWPVMARAWPSAASSPSDLRACTASSLMKGRVSSELVPVEADGLQAAAPEDSMTSFVQPMAAALPMQPQLAMAAPQQPMTTMPGSQPMMMSAPAQAQAQQLPYSPYGMTVNPYAMGMSPYGMANPYAMSPYGSMTPMSQQMLAQAMNPQMVQPQQPSKVGTILKGAALGAAAGAAFGLIPFLPLGLFSGAIVGAVGGAVLALLKSRKQQGQFQTMDQQQAQAQAQAQAAAMAQMAQSTPQGARSVASEAQPSTRQGVVMGPEMRKKWAAKVRAEQAAAAVAAKS